MTNGVNGTSALQQIMDTIDLGPTNSIQFMYAKLQMAQGMICKAQAEDYMKQIEDIQKDQQECAEMVAKARELQNEAKSGDKCTTMPDDMVAYFDKHGLKWETTGGDKKHDKDEWDYNIQSLTNYQETIGNKTQTLMVYLQDFISQYNSYTQGASSAISKASDVLTAVATGR